MMIIKVAVYLLKNISFYQTINCINKPFCENYNKKTTINTAFYNILDLAVEIILVFLFNNIFIEEKEIQRTPYSILKLYHILMKK